MDDIQVIVVESDEATRNSRRDVFGGNSFLLSRDGGDWC
jgi:hypothetical protein